MKANFCFQDFSSCSFLSLSVVSIQPLKMAKDTTKLKKHIALMCERLNKGAKLDLNRGAETEKSKPKKTLEPVSESAEDDEDGSTGIFLFRPTL